MTYAIYLVDAFTQQLFGGNTAAVIPVNEWPETALMQQIASENNQTATVFYSSDAGGNFKVRFFTPITEVPLSGHAAFATAHVLFNDKKIVAQTIKLIAANTQILITNNGANMEMTIPMDYFLETEAPEKLIKALGTTPNEIYIGREDYLCVFDYEEKVKRISPDFHLLAELKSAGIIVTAKGNDADYVCRYFAPAYGINEDPATGSIQGMLMNYWSKKLNKKELIVKQLSARGGNLTAKINGDVVYIIGNAITYLKGEINT